MKLYSVRDKVSGLFGAPINDVNDDCAIRGFQIACNTEGTLMYAKPTDFELYSIGSFDEETGAFISQGAVKIQDGRVRNPEVKENE